MIEIKQTNMKTGCLNTNKITRSWVRFPIPSNIQLFYVLISFICNLETFLIINVCKQLVAHLLIRYWFNIGLKYLFVAISDRNN